MRSFTDGQANSSRGRSPRSPEARFRAAPPPFVGERKTHLAQRRRFDVYQKYRVHRERQLVLQQLAACLRVLKARGMPAGLDLGDEALAGARYKIICLQHDLDAFGIHFDRVTGLDLACQQRVAVRGQQALGVALAALTALIVGAPARAFAQPSQPMHQQGAERDAGQGCEGRQQQEGAALHVLASHRLRRRSNSPRRATSPAGERYPRHDFLAARSPLHAPAWRSALASPFCDLANPPEQIDVCGELPDWSQALAIVGTRHPYPEAAAFARTLANELARAGHVIVSGGAEGIDYEAHVGALEAGGRSVAVLGAPLDRPYPSAHLPLFQAIAGRGAVLTEYPSGALVYPARFLERNRLIAALARRVIVVQAPSRSGALSTAREAIKLGRPLLAVPFAPWQSQAEGTLGLLADERLFAEVAEMSYR